MKSSRTLEKRFYPLPILLIIGGAGIILLMLLLETLGLGGQTGIGGNQVSVAIGGFAVLMTGIVLLTSVNERRVAEWLMVLAGVVAAAMAADLFVIGGLPDFGPKQVMLGSLVFGLALIGFVPATADRQLNPQAWLKDLSINWANVAKFFSITAQFALLVFVIRQFQLENQAFYSNIILLAFYGFIIHFFLPMRYRLPFFLLLSLAAIMGLLGLQSGAWLIGIGIGLIAITHLPLSFWTRVGLLLLAGTGLALLRSQIFPDVVPSVIWPIFGAIFMFRLMVYIYDLKHGKQEPTITSTLSYFFLLPNVIFLLFPIIDYSTFRRTYYDSDQYEIYQKGLWWMIRGAIYLILYRVVNYYLVMAPQDVANAGDLVLYMSTSFLLIMRVLGQFDLAIGMLHLFGFNLPEINYRIFLASGFTDFWRRANIYWKDFMLKIFYFPAYFRLRRWSDTTRLVLATIFVFFITWFLHAYQWFWLRGSPLLSAPDISYWTLLGLLVLINSLIEARFGRKRTLGAKKWTFRKLMVAALGTIGTFTTISILWSLWISPSISDWLGLLSAVAAPIDSLASLAPIFWMVGLLAGGSILTKLMGDPGPTARPRREPFFRKAAITGGTILLVGLIGSPFLGSAIGGKVEAVMSDLRVSRLSDRDAELLLRGYYEDLTGVDRFNSELWDIYSKRPSDWPLIHETEAASLTDNFMTIELTPSTQIMFHGARFTTNRWGMRDRDYELQAPPNTFRMALLGPSFVMGSGVNDEEVFEWLVEDRLNQEYAGSKYDGYQILNFGVAGHSALQELALLEQTVLSFQPDAVLLVSHQLEEENLIRNLSFSLESGMAIPYPYLEEIAAQAGITGDTPRSEMERRLKPFGPELVAWTYERIAQISRDHEILPVWIYMQTLEKAEDPEIQAELRRIAEEQGYIILDLSTVFAGHDPKTIEVAEWDRHPNTRGHQLLAQALYEALRSQPVLSEALGLTE